MSHKNRNPNLGGIPRPNKKKQKSFTNNYSVLAPCRAFAVKYGQKEGEANSLTSPSSPFARP